MKFLIFAITIILSITTYAQKKPKVTDKIDEFEGFRIIKADKKALGVVQLSVRAIITDKDTLYKVNTNLINTGGILDKAKPYFVILSNKNKYKLDILYSSIPSSFTNGSYITNYTFQIPNENVLEFMKVPIINTRIYYINNTYDELSGGVVTTSLTTYLTAIYNRVNAIDSKK